MNSQLSFFDGDYAAALDVIRRTKIPFPIVPMHLKHGLSEGHVCRDCCHRGRDMKDVREGVVIYHYYCWPSQSLIGVPEDTPACGKWELRR